MQRFRVEVTYTGIVDYEIYIRAIEGAGESSSRILGANSWQVSKASATTSAGVLIAAALTDRSGVLIKNWSTTGTVYIAETLAKATTDAYPLGPKDAIAMDIAAGSEVYAIADSTVDVRIVESGG